MEIDTIVKLANDDQILPGINDLVNILYNERINDYMNSECKTADDRRVMFMFLIMYFYSYLSIPGELTSVVDVKEMLKIFLSDLIKNSDKRKKCLEMYDGFEDTIKTIGFSANKMYNDKKNKIENQS
jgi:hypothetical protein